MGGWLIKPGTIGFESPLDNGVGQTVALTLRLVSPTSSSLDLGNSSGTSTVTPDIVTPVSTTPTTPTSPSGVPLAVAALSSPAVSSIGLAPIPASLMVTVNSGLLGGATPQTEQIAAVGPAVPGGTVALTDSSSGLMRGITYSSRGTEEDQTSNRPEDTPGAAGPSLADRGSTGSTSGGAATSLEAAQGSTQADASAPFRPIGSPASRRCWATCSRWEVVRTKCHPR